MAGDTSKIALNGAELAITNKPGPRGWEFPSLLGKQVASNPKSNTLTVAARSYSFLEFPNAAATVCT